MKILKEYCRQPRAYADSYGKIIIELEDGDNVVDVKAKYIKNDRAWYETQYYNPTETTEYTDNGTTYRGRLLVMDTHRVYLD